MINHYDGKLPENVIKAAFEDMTVWIDPLGNIHIRLAMLLSIFDRSPTLVWKFRFLFSTSVSQIMTLYGKM